MPLKVTTWNLENLFRNGNAFRLKTKAMYKEKQQVATFKTRYRGRLREPNGDF